MSKLETISWASVAATAAMVLEPLMPAWLYAVIFGVWFGGAMYLALTHNFGARSW